MNHVSKRIHLVKSYLGVMFLSQQNVFNRIATGVDASTSASGKWLFKCPLPTHGKGRGDRRPSAELFEDEKGKIGVVCYAGCNNRELWRLAVAPYLDTGPGAERQGRDNADDYLVAVYQHPDGKPRKVFRQDCPGQTVCSRKNCKNREPGKHIWQTRGQHAGCYILLWGNDDGNGPVVICEGEKAAAAVARAGFTGASWIGGSGKAGQPITAAYRADTFWYGRTMTSQALRRRRWPQRRRRNGPPALPCCRPWTGRTVGTRRI